MRISYQVDFEFPDDATLEERQFFLSDVHQLVTNLMPLLFDKHGLEGSLVDPSFPEKTQGLH